MCWVCKVYLESLEELDACGANYDFHGASCVVHTLYYMLRYFFDSMFW